MLLGIIILVQTSVSGLYEIVCRITLCVKCFNRVAAIKKKRFNGLYRRWLGDRLKFLSGPEVMNPVRLTGLKAATNQRTLTLPPYMFTVNDIDTHLSMPPVMHVSAGLRSWTT